MPTIFAKAGHGKAVHIAFMTSDRLHTYCGHMDGMPCRQTRKALQVRETVATQATCKSCLKTEEAK
jgi:hypothetical protein